MTLTNPEDLDHAEFPNSKHPINLSTMEERIDPKFPSWAGLLSKRGTSVVAVVNTASWFNLLAGEDIQPQTAAVVASDDFAREVLHSPCRLFDSDAEPIC